MKEHEEWLRDADSCYLSARGLGLLLPKNPAVFDGFVLLAHHALERYLKGTLSASDSNLYTTDYLRKTFVHDLTALLKEVGKFAPQLAIQPLQDACEILTKEWKHARYLVTADPSKVHPAATKLDLARLDEIVCVVRNAFVHLLSSREAADSIVAQLNRAGVPFEYLREILTQQNLALGKFEGI